MEPKDISAGIAKLLETAWNNGDGNAFGDPFTDVADFVDIRGTFYPSVSKSALAGAHHQLLASIYKGSTITYEVKQANAVDDNTILTHVAATLDSPSGPLQGVKHSTISMVICRRGEEWKVRSFHNTLVVE